MGIPVEQFVHGANTEFRQTGLSAPHAYVMRLVLDDPGLSQKQLAEELHLDPSTVTRFID